MKFITLGLSVVVFVLIVIAILPADAQPNVIWSPQRITEEIIVGQEHNVTVELNFLQGGQNLKLRVVPALAKVLTVEPENIDSAEAGDTISVTLHFTADPGMSEALLDGVVQVRSGRKTIAKPLPVTLNIVTSPLRNIDNDHDGIWDDIQVFIDNNYSNNPNLHSAARQFVHGLQNALLNSSDPAGSQAAATEIQRAIECLFGLQAEEANTTRKEIMAAFLNSDQRARAYLLFNLYGSDSPKLASF